MADMSAIDWGLTAMQGFIASMKALGIRPSADAMKPARDRMESLLFKLPKSQHAAIRETIAAMDDMCSETSEACAPTSGIFEE